MSVEAKAKKTRQSGIAETIRIVIHALILAMIVRVFLFQPFNIPSGSMKSTLLVGDYLFVSKFSYGYSKYSFFNLDLFDGRIWSDKPKRGDVAVFKLPRDNKTDYIKRVIGLPGDEIRMQNGVLYIDGKAVPKKRVDDFVSTNYAGRRARIRQFEETLPNGVKYFVLDSDPNGSFDDTNVYKVPDGHYFMMGDNRDNSTDSRAQYAVGFVPHENFVGRAEVIFFSADQYWSLFAPWRWLSATRWSRIFDLVR
ncbi:MAG: signal peptidase I [Methyloligellaceae bacterium]